MVTGIGGEVGWWCPSLDDAGAGTGTVNNLSGPLNNGSISSARWTTNEGLRCLDVNNTYMFSVAHSAAFVLPDTYTYTFWLNTPALFNNYGISNKGQNIPRVLACVCSSTGFYCQHGTAANVFQYAGGGTLSVDTWTHLAITQVKVGSTYTLSSHKNGVLQASVSHTSTPSASTSALSMGGNIGNQRLAMLIDDIRIFYEDKTSAIPQLASRRGFQPSSRRQQRSQQLIN